MLATAATRGFGRQRRASSAHPARTPMPRPNPVCRKLYLESASPVQESDFMPSCVVLHAIDATSARWCDRRHRFSAMGRWRGGARLTARFRDSLVDFSTGRAASNETPTRAAGNTRRPRASRRACPPRPAGHGPRKARPRVGAEEPCDVGTYSGSGESECTPCDPGSYANKKEC